MPQVKKLIFRVKFPDGSTKTLELTAKQIFELVNTETRVLDVTVSAETWELVQ